MKSNSTLRLGRIKYRGLAEQAKLAGCCLAVSTFKEMGCWGLFSPYAQAVHADVSVDSPSQQERIVLTVSTSVDAGLLRSVTRPEIDWGALEDHEIFDFIAAHEIGHRVDNHSIFDIWRIDDNDVAKRCQAVIGGINEVLADRYAWAHVRPGEPVPVSENGRRLQEQVADAMALLNQHAPRPRRAHRALPGGQYAWVPDDMLHTDQLMAFVGPNTSPALVERTRNRRRIYRRDPRQRLLV